MKKGFLTFSSSLDSIIDQAKLQNRVLRKILSKQAEVENDRRNIPTNIERKNQLSNSNKNKNEKD